MTAPPPDSVGLPRPSGRTFGVIGAMAEEVRALVASLQDPTATARGPFLLHAGRLEGRSVVVAECGIGKVNAAALTQVLIDAGAEAVIFTGVAGATRGDLAVGDVVVSTDAVQHDVDVTPLGYERGEVPVDGIAWAADPALIDAAVAAAREAAAADGPPNAVVTGRIASGDRFIASAAAADDLRQTFGAVCAEMEGAAVAQVCAKWAVPFVIIRSISDTADGDAHTDFRAFTALAAARADRVVRGMLRRL